MTNGHSQMTVLNDVNVQAIYENYVNEDGYFAHPFIDEFEFRKSPITHTYVHGGFKDTNTRFSFYFPAEETYERRFFQHVTPVPSSEHLAMTARGQEDRMGFAFSEGAYFIETNGGGQVEDPSINAYRANAASAIFSRSVAQHIYGEGRVYGYLYGGSGGGFRTMGASEHSSGVWDGFVPYVIGTPMALPNVFSVRMHAQRVLRGVLDKIVDEFEPGGSGDPYPHLNEEQAAAFKEVTAMGYPTKSWTDHRTMGTQAFAVIYPVLRFMDPSYFEDFWVKPGYLGADSAPSASVHTDRIRFTTKVSKVVWGEVSSELESAAGGVDNAFIESNAARPIHGLVLQESLPIDCLGARLTATLTDGEEVSYMLKSGEGNEVIFDIQDFGIEIAELPAGTDIHIDNSDFIAAQTYHRHQVPDSSFKVWDQFRDESGNPVYPQRPFLLGPLITNGVTGGGLSGNINGKMIVVSSLLDREAYPWQSDWYAQQVANNLGDQTEANFRLWFTENALHGDVEKESSTTHYVSYLGCLHAALRSLYLWVEQSVSPAKSTKYELVDGQIIVPDGAADRHGVQPSIQVSVNGSETAICLPGEKIEIAIQAASPDNSVPLYKIEIDADADGIFETTLDTPPAQEYSTTVAASLSVVGTHFVTIRVVAQDPKNYGTPFGRLENLARLRVSVRDR